MYNSLGRCYKNYRDITSVVCVVSVYSYFSYRCHPTELVVRAFATFEMIVPNTKNMSEIHWLNIYLRKLFVNRTQNHQPYLHMDFLKEVRKNNSNVIVDILKFSDRDEREVPHIVDHTLSNSYYTFFFFYKKIINLHPPKCF